MSTLLIALFVVQALTVPLAWWAWSLDGRPRPFRRWLLTVAFSERAVEAMERRP